MLRMLSTLLLLAAAPATAASGAPLAEARAAYAAFDHARAVELLEPLARGGNAQAQRMLGWMYSNGQGVERDQRQAARWYCESVRKDPWDSAPCPWFVLLVRQQPGVVWESLEPVGVERWRNYLDAAERGEADAQVVLGLLYTAGLETRRDPVEAYKWFLLAAEQRHPSAGALIEQLELELTPEQIERGRRLAAEWRPRAGE
jgi:TPR repeat protein